MAHTTNYTDLIGRSHSVTRYSKGEKLTYRTEGKGELIVVVALGPGHPMEPGFTPVQVIESNALRYPHGNEFVAANEYLSPR